jgi:RNA polymerase sigma factor (sigma-70 family)
MSDTDLELLARYSGQNTEDAFAELVRRHIDLVHSAALRQVRSPQLAEEVTQSTFIKLARHASQLARDTILTAWLYQVTRREAIDVVRREARRQLREQTATEMNAMNATTADWTHIEPILDEAMHALDDTDRAVVLLRYFKNHDLRSIGATLGISDDAAQKRVSRAVDRLREFFAKRGVTIGASGLAVVISANAVQAAPVGLAVAISTAAVLAGTTLATTATVTATKAIAMTALQKTVVAATIAVLAGAGIYEARQASQLRDQVQILQQQQAPLAEQIQQLQRERESATNRLDALQADNERLNRNTRELLRLRAEIHLTRTQLAELRLAKNNSTEEESTRLVLGGILALENYVLIQKERFKRSQERVEKMIQELELPSDLATNIYTLAESDNAVDELYTPLIIAVRNLNQEGRAISIVEKRIETEMVKAGRSSSK